MEQLNNEKVPYSWVNEDSLKFLRNGYLSEGECHVKRFDDICDRVEELQGHKIKNIGKRFKKYFDAGFYCLSSPIIANFGKANGLPISCFGSYVPDTIQGISSHLDEMMVMTKVGGGTSAYWGDVRPLGSLISDGGKSNGPRSFLEINDVAIDRVSQGNTRRGAYAAYMDVRHADILDFMNIKSEGDSIQNINYGVCIDDDWMSSMAYDGDVEKRKIWGKIIQKKYETGFPYIFYTDNVNNAAPKEYKETGRRIYASNLCTEIMLSTSDDESFVCDLGHINLEKWDEIKDTDAVEVLFYFLDAVMTEFIEKASKVRALFKAVNFAKRQRAIGLGAVGYHGYLQSCDIAFESFEAKMKNAEIFKTIEDKTLVATKNLAEWFGEPELMKGSGKRNVTRMAIAPTTSSSFIVAQSTPSTEPLAGNYFTKDLAKGKFTYKNPYLRKVLEKHNKSDRDTWKSILVHGGSVQHLDFLSEHEKNVFKTFQEISQMEIVVQAAQRQKFIDQGQSLNLKIPSDAPAKEVSDLYIKGWELGIKTFYYQRGTNPAQELARSLTTCVSCEG